MRMNTTGKGHLMALFTIIVWGTTYISSKLLLADFHPVELLFFRMALAVIALLIVYPHRMKGTTFRKELYYAGAGLTGVTLYFLLENWALTYSFASNVGVIIAVAPMFTAFLARWVNKGEQIRPMFYVGFVVSMVGIILISFNGSQEFHLNPLGDFLALLAAVVWAIYSNLVKKIGNFGYHTIQNTRKIFLYGLIFLIPTLPFMEFRLDLKRFLNPVYAANILFLGLLASALCFVTWNQAVKILGAVKTSTYIYASPVVTVVTSMIILKEPLTTTAGIGVLLTMAGLVLSELRKKEGNYAVQEE